MGASRIPSLFVGGFSSLITVPSCLLFVLILIFLYIPKFVAFRLYSHHYITQPVCLIPLPRSPQMSSPHDSSPSDSSPHDPPPSAVPPLKAKYPPHPINSTSLPHTIASPQISSPHDSPPSAAPPTHEPPPSATACAPVPPQPVSGTACTAACCCILCVHVCRQHCCTVCRQHALLHCVCELNCMCMCVPCVYAPPRAEQPIRVG